MPLLAILPNVAGCSQCLTKLRKEVGITASAVSQAIVVWWCSEGGMSPTFIHGGDIRAGGNCMGCDPCKLRVCYCSHFPFAELVTCM